jgi:hypothetical protein
LPKNETEGHPRRAHRDRTAWLRIERAFGDFPIKALDDPRSRSVFLEWRDNLARTSLRQADYAYNTLARILRWSLDRPNHQESLFWRQQALSRHASRQDLVR